ncbi:MAG: lipoyl(octanoyl) transferase LipB [Candidatus Bipolaricaulota bacterium]|nr:lipoyl(octanoyl) transferase LipB [Candidatus Bipolaricaulota bacterium]
MRQAIHLPLGHLEYGVTYNLQRRLLELRRLGEIADAVITVEHDPVFTIGRSGSRDEILVDEPSLAREGISIHQVERGGRITYHGPGQLVLYPIIDLRDHGRDIRGYVRNLEQSVIDYLEEVGIAGTRREGFPGVWVKTKKIASIGVYVRHWITMHGLAVNVDVNKSHFQMINPCGLQIQVTSVAEHTTDDHPLTEVGAGLLSRLARLFQWRFKEVDPARFIGVGAQGGHR